jgi:hypothetical protein
LQEVKRQIQRLKAAWPAIGALQEQSLELVAGSEAGGENAWVKAAAHYASKGCQLLDAAWGNAVLQRPLVWSSTAVRSGEYSLINALFKLYHG